MQLVKYTSFIFLVISSSCTKQPEYHYLENFDNNDNGWAEEKTVMHTTKFIDGKLMLQSLDTVGRLSSNGPADGSIFGTLGKDWKFETSIESFDGNKESGFGFKLYSQGAIECIFRIARSGLVQVYQNDYNLNQPYSFETKNISEFGFNTPILLSLEVHDEDFVFHINGQQVCKNKFSATSWRELRLFTESGGTGIKADYYKVSKL
ncbi:hypothetical protein [Reichenbachiella versicolor]|uniref:hypothetical protein n=1 Tax=Reichenbachiella versicolor TaxID=1821036 RepID=UPI000D6DCF48|nr:hypothetical protein [Reichenbachiella versicolor]